jgi:hypothetical protein
MPSVRFATPIGPFRDTVQQRDVPVMAFITCEYMSQAPGDPAQIENDVRLRLSRAVNGAITPKMASGELQFRNLGEGTFNPSLLGEIVSASGLAQVGVQVGNLSMQFGIDGRDPTPPRQQQQPPQQQVAVHANIGGLNINATSGGGLDTQGLQNQLKDKAKSQILWYGIGCGILFLVVVGIGGMGLYIWHGVSTSGGLSGTAAAPAKWNGSSTFTCSGNDNVRIEGTSAKLATTAISATGNCKLTLVNVDITAPTGIEAGLNAVVTVQGGSITATTFAVHATGNAQVHVTGTKLSGKTLATPPNAKITGV